MAHDFPNRSTPGMRPSVTYWVTRRFETFHLYNNILRVPATRIIAQSKRCGNPKTQKTGQAHHLPALHLLYRPLRPVSKDECQPIPNNHPVHQGQEKVAINKPRPIFSWRDRLDRPQKQPALPFSVPPLRLLSFHRIQLSGYPVHLRFQRRIASPAICANRMYKRYLREGDELPSFLPSQLARVFINRMNTAESTAVVELACGRKSEDAHWQNLLTYCRQGNLQAVLDEYAHILASGIDRDSALVQQIHRQMMSALDMRTTLYAIDTFRSFQKRIRREKERPTNIRTHFAVAFTKGENKETDTDRKKTLRNAFNAPFRPFVLATTSIGQEGLDFHNYCRRIVHWNLPSNPIDLEQREGRINRFECLAVRQNIAKRYGTIPFEKDVWDEMFTEAARKEKTAGSSDLIPYWGLRESEDMLKIERIVPMYPFSRDGLAYERLIRILSFYRLTLGQARQEELLEYLFKNCEDPDRLKELFINLSPFYREHRRLEEQSISFKETT